MVQEELEQRTAECWEEEKNDILPNTFWSWKLQTSKLMSSSSTFVQDEVTRITFSFLLKQQKRKHETMFLNSLDFTYI